MIYRWLEEADVTIASIEKLTGMKVKSLQKGGIKTGEMTQMPHPEEDGVMLDIPITRKGIEVEFGGDLPSAKLEELDAVMVNFKLWRNRCHINGQPKI